jgi:hypothetical protein
MFFKPPYFSCLAWTPLKSITRAGLYRLHLHLLVHGQQTDVIRGAPFHAGILRRPGRDLGKVVIIPFPTKSEDFMRKMIMMAIAGFLLKKVQSRFNKQTYSGNPVRRY